MTCIVKALEGTVKSNFTKLLQYIYSDIDRFLVLIFTASIFAPFYITIACACCISVMIMINYKKREKAFRAPYTKLLFGFLAVAFFVAAIYNNYAGMGCSILCCAVVVCGLYLRSVMTRGVFNQAMDLACAGSVWCLFIAIFQKASLLASAPNYRPVSVFFNANYYGMIIEFVVIIALYRIFTNPDLSAFYFAVIGLNMIGLYLSASFSSFAAMFCAVFVMLLLKKKYIPASAFLVFGIFCVALFVLFPMLLPRGSEAIDHTVAQRLSIWTAAMKGIKQHPLFGQGAMSYWLVCDEFGGYKTYHCHNLLLDILLNYGIFGLTAIGVYSLTQIRLLWLRIKNNICGNMNILLFAAATAVIVHGMTDVTIFSAQTGALFLMVYSSIGIGSAYLEKSAELPKLLPRYHVERTSQTAYYIKN